MENYLEVGKIVGTHGLKGFVKIKPLTDDISRFDELEKIYIGKELTEFHITEVKYLNNMVALKLERCEFNRGSRKV